MSARTAESVGHARQALLLDVWREVARTLDLESSIEPIAARAAAVLPVALMLVRHLDLAHRRLETVAVGGPGDRHPATASRRSSIDAAQVPALLNWFRGRRATRSADGADPIARLVLPTGVTGEVVIGPLHGEEGPNGVLLFVAGDRWSAAQVLAAADLLEPLGAALANDLRVRDLARRSASLEADKRALLSRLDRQDVSDAIVGADAGLRDVIARVEQVAATDTPVLLIGETGSGKEVVARLVHGRSRRARGPIVRVNCGAIPPGLVDSELFGHGRGSFTGAVGNRLGWFERADGGTLFLDEIGELPLEAQVRLLRILQDGTFERVGGRRPLTVDVRIVAATHRDLQEMVARGTFREDLWYRLGVFPIWLPPLRDRPEDIPVLASHFARRAGMRLAGTPLVPTPQDLEALLRYDWPGNVRELAAVIERAAILGDGHSLRIDAALGDGTGARAARPAAPGTGTPASVVPIQTGPQPPGEPAGADAWRPGGVVSVGTAPVLPPPAWPTAADRPRDAGAGHGASLDAAMRAHIEAVLIASAGRIEGPFGAAVRLRVNPHTLRSRMRRLGIDWRRFRPGAGR
jgi:transcriptional regulator with GAF, ATPase, and Fis domain